MELNASLLLVRPELILSFSALALLLLAAWREQAGRLISILAVAALSAAAAYVINFMLSGTNSSAFEGLLVNDAFGNFSKILIFIAAALSLMIAPRFLENAGAMRAEYPVLILLSCIGMGVMVSATDLISLYIGLELQSLSAYVLASFVRSDGRSAEAGLKYFVLGALASGMLGSSISTSFEPVPPNQRSLSAMTLSMHAKTSGFPLVRHNVFFNQDYQAEFEDIFHKRQLPSQGTVYV
jgi:NADH-quinone oxidoreductase subunit N